MLKRLLNHGLLKEILYYINEISTKCHDKRWLKSRFVYHVIRRYYLLVNNPLLEKSILDLEWDNLLILDACRYDLFNTLVKRLFNKNCQHLRSRGTETPEFLKNTFILYDRNNQKKSMLKDIIYITTNPWVDIICKNLFFKLVPVWKCYWDEKLGTVHPYYVNKITLRLRSKYPNKKFIVHYLQPHNPYIGFDHINKLSYDDYPVKNPKGIILTKPFKAVESGKIPTEKLWEAYKYNLKIVLKYALYLSYYLKGRTIITADHGEAFGEKIHPLLPIRIYGHPPSVRIPTLVKVPWFIVDEIKNEIDIKDLKKEVNRLKPKSTKDEKMILREKIAKLKSNKMCK